MKKILLTTLFSMFALVAMSQAVGDWILHPVFGSNAKIVDTKDNVYYLSGYNVYCYDKVNDETISFSRKNNLSDTKAEKIFYDFNNRNLVIVYSNSNIDIMDRNGKVFNIPELKDAVLSYSKTINYISFVGDEMYLATDFGYMVVNTRKCEIKETHFYGRKVYAATKCGGFIVLCSTDGIYTSPADANHFDFSSFTNVNAGQVSKVAYYINDSRFLVDTGWIMVAKVNSNGTIGYTTVAKQSSRSIQSRSDGSLIINSNDGNFYSVAQDGTIATVAAVPAEYASSALTSYGDNTYWGIDSKGVCSVKIDESGNVTLLQDYARPNASTVWYPQYLVYNNALKQLLVCNVGSLVYKESYDDLAAMSTYDGSFWKDANVYDNVPTPNRGDGLLRSPYAPEYDPEDPSVFYVGTWYEGLYRIKDGVITHNYYYGNAPFYKYVNWNCLVPCVKFDKDNNLWAINSFNNEEIFVLPRAKQGVDNTTAADWQSVALPGFRPEKSAAMIFTKKGIKVFHEGKYGSSLFFLNDNGTLSTSDDVTKSYANLIDQDEKTYSWNYILTFVEDLNGKVWMGTTNGIVEFSPEKAFSSNFRINHIKVPRNDGTNYADYLLENQSVLAIAVDGANRKWLGTLESGLYLVSEDGSEIIEHFTTENSYLPSNQVISVCCNPNNNSVYVGTNCGMVEFLSNAYPASDSYSNVYAYPNPVRPDFTGYITVRGLMDNSLVKIADAAGNVIYSGMSVGGMFTWDGNKSDGSRVDTGVYYVLASQNGSDKSSGAVTKIMVIN